MKLTAQKALGANNIVNERGEVVATAVDEQTAKLLAAAPALAAALAMTLPGVPVRKGASGYEVDAAARAALAAAGITA